MLQAGSLCFPARHARLIGTVLTPRFFVAVMVAFLAHTSGAITLERVLQTTLDENPAIQEAKSGLEQASRAAAGFSFPGVAARRIGRAGRRSGRSPGW